MMILKMPNTISRILWAGVTAVKEHGQEREQDREQQTRKTGTARQKMVFKSSTKTKNRRFDRHWVEVGRVLGRRKTA